MTLPTSIEARIDRSRGVEACHPWTGGRYEKGYGHVTYGGKLWRVHRLVWTLLHGPIPNGVQVLHTCDNPPCCNDAHLFLGDNAANVADKMAKGRHVAGGRKKLTQEEAAAIRKEYAAGGVTHGELAGRYNVHTVTIHRVVTGKRY